MTFNYHNINKVLEAIFPLPKNFGLIQEEQLETDAFWDLEYELHSIDPSAFLSHGASKLVIISPNFGNVVIKIPFNGFYIEDNENGDLYWQDFSWATGSDSSDYCLAEYEKYHKLKAYGLDCFVAKTLYYKTICGFRIFLQEKIIPENDLYLSYTPTAKSKKLADKWRNEGIFYIDSEWIANCLDKYGQSKVKRFLNYCSNIDLDILEDSHCGNFGYRENGTPAILDYSNFLD